MSPHRLVDGRGVGWIAVDDTRTMYYSQQLLLTREQVQQQFPPTRPVEPPPAGDAAYLLDAVQRLLDDPVRRRLLAGTLCVALDDAGQRAGRKCSLTAVRPDSNESLAVTTMTCVIGPDLAGDPARYDPLVRHVVADVVLDWVTGPDRYVEVGENLATLIGPAVARAGGWPAVADQQLQHGPYADTLSWYVTSHAEVSA